ncbi:MAG: helix-turn-helix transcriptional regulator [Acidobacteriota bacterium]
MARSISHPDLADVTLSAVLQALSDPVRLEIVRQAANRDALPCNAFIGCIPKSTLSHHWRVLREAGLLRQCYEGTQKLNSLRREELDARFPGLIDAVLAADQPL